MAQMHRASTTSRASRTTSTRGARAWLRVGLLLALTLVLLARGGHAAAGHVSGRASVAGRVAGRASAGGYQQWYVSHPLGVARALGTATLLGTGQVLIAGGTNLVPGDLASAELYNPRTYGFTPTGAMLLPREQHTATLLRSGQVLIAGGEVYNSNVATSEAELYNPATGTFTATGSMTAIRVNHTATLLADGRVLIAGGCVGIFEACVTMWQSAELYNPATGTFTATGNMTTPRLYDTATLLPSGKVLIAGGALCGSCFTLATAELYDPATGTFTPTGSMRTPRAFHTATLLATGHVLIAGGCTTVSGDCYPAQNTLATAELYDPATGTFTPTGNLTLPRGEQMATRLYNGQVLLVGGVNGQHPADPLNPWEGSILTSTELYNPQTGTFTATGTLHVGRDAALLAPLFNGEVLVAGGCFLASGVCGSLKGSPIGMKAAEVYVP